MKYDSLVPHSAHLEAQGRADGEEPGERAREAIEVGLHQGALLVLEELDVALPDQIVGRPSSLRGRRRVLQDTASPVDRLEAGEDGRVVGLRPRRARRRSIPSSAVPYARCTQKMSSKMALFVARIVFTSSMQQRLLATEAARDVHVAGAVGVQPERKEGEPDVVRRERSHARPT